MDICQRGYNICEFDSLRCLRIDIIGRVHFENRDRFAILIGSFGQYSSVSWPFRGFAEYSSRASSRSRLERRPNHVNKWVVADIWIWQFLEPWHGRWYEYKIVVALCTDNIYNLENERWLLEGMIDHVGINGSRVAEGLSAFNVGLVKLCLQNGSHSVQVYVKSFI